MIVFNGLSLSAIGSSSPIILGSTQGTILGQLNGEAIKSLGISCTVSPGANLTYQIQISCDLPASLTNWLDHDTLVAISVSQYGQIIYPVSAIRLNVSAWVSGTVTAGVVQWP